MVEQSNSKAGLRVTWFGIWANLVLIVGKFFAGVIGNSQALIADAIHSVSDIVTDAVVLFGLKVGRKGPDEDHHYGHGRIETVASALVGFTLIGVAFYLAYEAIHNIYHHVEYQPTWVALVGAGFSIVVKEIVYRVTIKVGREINSPVVIANAWHHRSDSLSSLAVLIGVTAALIKPEFHIMDAYATVFVALLVAKVGIDVSWQALREVTDTAPDQKIIDKIMIRVGEVSGVLGAHDLRVRSVAGRFQIQVHIVVKGSLTVTEGHSIAKSVEFNILDEIPGEGEVIVHVDPQGPDFSN